MLLAMTGTMTDEQYLKSYLTSLGYKVAVTEVSGKYRSSAFQSQMIRSVLGAVLNQEVISKIPTMSMLCSMRWWTRKRPLWGEWEFLGFGG